MTKQRLSAVLIAVFASAATLTSASTVRAQADEPSVEDVRAAGDEFNLGRTAFKDEDYATAAEHFEKADSLVPNPKVLLLAIQSREQAGHAARAATLAALAQDRYPDEEMFAETRTLIRDGLASMSKLKVTCDEPCTLLVDSRLVHGAASTKRFLFLEAGSYHVKAAFEGGETETKDFTAVAGAAGKLHFEKEPTGAAPVAEDDWGEEPQDDVLPQPHVTYDSVDSSPGASKDEYDLSKDGGGLPPTVFWIGAGLTVATAGVAIWSGVDAQDNPGPDVVRERCVGLGTSCPEYQQGKSAELRTNVLWGVTAGLGLTTILVGSIWTDWGPPSLGLETTAKTQRARSVGVEPWVAFGDGATLGARGRF